MLYDLSFISLFYKVRIRKIKIRSNYCHETPREDEKAYQAPWNYTTNSSLRLHQLGKIQKLGR